MMSSNSTRADINDLVLTFSKTATRISGMVADARGNVDPDADVIAFPADTTGWRHGLFPSSHRMRVTHTTSTAAFEFMGLAPGEYYVAAASARLTTTWDDPAWLERLIPGATKIVRRGGRKPDRLAEDPDAVDQVR